MNDGGSRVKMIDEIFSFVLQDAPKSPVRICLTKIQSWTQYGWSTPSWRRMLSICSWLLIFPAST